MNHPSVLQNLAEVSAFNEQAGNDAGDGQEDSANAGFVHEDLPLRPDAPTPIRRFNGRARGSAALEA